jgi:hypothetical protein
MAVERLCRLFAVSAFPTVGVCVTVEGCTKHDIELGNSAWYAIGECYLNPGLSHQMIAGLAKAKAGIGPLFCTSIQNELACILLAKTVEWIHCWSTK